MSLVATRWRQNPFSIMGLCGVAGEDFISRNNSSQTKKSSQSVYNALLMAAVSLHPVTLLHAMTFLLPKSSMVETEACQPGGKKR